MKYRSPSLTQAFTLVELLVVITILSIISVVAYQNFWGAVDKAVSGRKISDVSTIETSLQQYKVDKNFYPAVWEYSATNIWGYDPTATTTDATPSNPIEVTYDGQAIQSFVPTAWNPGGGRVMNNASTPAQIWAKGTISKNELGKYLTKDLFDPELWDVKINDTDSTLAGDQNGTMIESYGIGRYVYSVYRKTQNWPTNKEGSSYNIAYTIKKDGSEDYITKIVGDYSPEDSCLNAPTECPETLIWTFDNHLLDGDIINAASDTDSYGIPYAVNDFAG